MKREIRDAVFMAGGLLAIWEISGLAFHFKTRKEIGMRDNWTCQGLHGRGCVMEHINGGKPARYQDGYMVTAAHWPEAHGAFDDDPEAGRILCTLDHAIEEVERGNRSGAGKLLKMGVYSWDHQKKTGEQWRPSLDEVRQIRETLTNESA